MKMGAWGPGPFDNDDAADWIATFSRHPSYQTLLTRFRDVLKARKPDSERCAKAVAAGEVLAVIYVAGVRGMPSELRPWIKSITSVSKADRQLAIDAIERILSESELKELWSTVKVNSWARRTREIVTKLSEDHGKKVKSLPSKPIKPPRTVAKKAVAGECGDLIAISMGEGEYAVAKIFYRSSQIPHLIGLRIVNQLFKSQPTAALTFSRFHGGRIWTGDGLIKSGKWKVLRSEPLTADDEQAQYWISGSTLYRGDQKIRKRGTGDLDSFGVKMITPPRMVAHSLRNHHLASS